jgi:hypothetical protein
MCTAEAQNKFFASVFTHEDTSNVSETQRETETSLSMVTSVANRSKFLLQNTKVAGKKYQRQKTTAAYSAPKLGQKGLKWPEKNVWSQSQIR